MVLDKIREIIKPAPETKKIQLEEIETIFRQNKEKEIAKNQKKLDKQKKKLSKEVENLKESLEFLEGFEDDKERQRFEDVAHNIYEKSREIEEVNQTNPEHVQEFLDKLSLDKKEMAVLERLPKDGKQLLNAIRKTEYHLEQIKQLKQESPEQKLQSVLEKKEKLEKLLKDREKLEKEKEKKDIELIRKKLRNKEKELDKFYDGDVWQKKQELEEEIESSQDEIEKIENGISSTVSSVERALKKVEYESASKLSNFAINLRKNNWEQITDYKELSEETVDRIKDICDEKQLKRFRDKKEEIKNIPSKLREIEKLKEQKEGLEQEKEELDLSKMKKLKSERRKLEKEMESNEKELEKLDSQINAKESSIEHVRKELEEDINEELYDDYNLKL